MWVGAVHGTDASPCGKIVEVECMGITPDGRLREPRFKGIRYDKAGTDA
jgi:DNA ligase-1